MQIPIPLQMQRPLQILILLQISIALHIPMQIPTPLQIHTQHTGALFPLLSTAQTTYTTPCHIQGFLPQHPHVPLHPSTGQTSPSWSQLSGGHGCGRRTREHSPPGERLRAQGDSAWAGEGSRARAGLSPASVLPSPRLPPVLTVLALLLPP